MRRIRISVEDGFRADHGLEGIRNYLQLCEDGDALGRYCLTLKDRSPAEWTFLLRRAAQHIHKTTYPHGGMPTVRRVRTYTEE